LFSVIKLASLLVQQRNCFDITVRIPPGAPFFHHSRTNLGTESEMAALRPWSPFSKVARLLQTGRTIEDPYDLVWIAVVRSQAYGRPAMRKKRSFVGGAAASQTDSVRTRRVVPISVNLVRLAALVTPDSAIGRADYPHR
jgi:hypothetical protein